MSRSRITVISSSRRGGKRAAMNDALNRMLDAGYTVTFIEGDRSETRGASVAKDVTPPKREVGK